MKYLCVGAVLLVGAVGAVYLYAFATMAGVGIKVGKGQTR